MTFYGHIITDSYDSVTLITNVIFVKEIIQFLKILNDIINNIIFITIDSDGIMTILKVGITKSKVYGIS